MTKITNNPKFKKARIIKRLRKTGNITKACKDIIERRQYYYWLNIDKEFKGKCRDALVQFMLTQ